KSLALVVAASFSLPALAQLDTEAQKRGYSVGGNIGVNLAAQGLENELDQTALAHGIRAGPASNLQMSEVEILEVLQGLQDLLQEKAFAEQEAFAQQGRDFLMENGGRAGVTTTASGLQYEVLKSSDLPGAPTPSGSDTVSV